MKIFNVTRTSRSNSLPVTPQKNQSVRDDTTDSDSIAHFIRATTFMHHTVHPMLTGGTERTNDVHASRRYLAPVQNESYMTIQAVEPSLVAEEAQGTSDEEPPDIVVTRVLPNYATPAVAHRGRLFAKCQKGRRLVQKNGRSNVVTKKVGHRSFFTESLLATLFQGTV